MGPVSRPRRTTGAFLVGSRAFLEQRGIETQRWQERAEALRFAFTDLCGCRNGVIVRIGRDECAAAAKSEAIAARAHTGGASTSLRSAR
jgi:hypothetical protein